MPALQEVVADTLFNKACFKALGSDVAGAIEGLRAWAAHQGEFDCAKVTGDTDFDAIRETPEFKAFLKEMGC